VSKVAKSMIAHWKGQVVLSQSQAKGFTKAQLKQIDPLVILPDDMWEWFIEQSKKVAIGPLGTDL
jgi:hypothetical protein